MKKILFILTVILAVAVPTFADNNYSIKCWKCKERAIRKNFIDYGCISCNAWRMYNLEGEHTVSKYDEKKHKLVLTKAGHVMPGYMVYQCEHGHRLYISYKDPKDRK